MTVRIGVNGLDHGHVFEIVDRLVKAGAEVACHVPDGGYLEHWETWQAESQAVTGDEMLADDTIDLVVTAAVPNRRADIALAAIAAGKHVVTDKPGLTTMAQLDAIRAAVAGKPGRPWTVLFTERYENRAISEAVRLARSGAVGRIVHVVGAGPHTMWAKRRPDWFWDPVATGGILVDIGSHQVDQFLTITDLSAADVSVVAAAVGNVASPDHPAMEDIGSMTLAGPAVVSDHRLDYLTAKGLGTWGDCRLTIVGVDGTIEARANVDVAGADGAEHLIVVDHDGTRRVDV
ncbi:MAG TPA: Gfo/Idh/MocA family oxidoreductase, partial [Ilumatobacteraceae bacterium]|nr:Gfo/Idh/MocA family oxidoreductase [Ilumatobacteraceae bacterium]